jgi:hypothetical protein
MMWKNIERKKKRKMAKPIDTFWVVQDPSSPVEKKITGFRSLKKGWHYGEGKRPETHTIDVALKLVEEASLWDLETDAFPGVSGEILIAVYHGDDCLEFIVEPSGRITASLEEDSCEVSTVEDLSIEGALAELNDFADKRREVSWNTSEFSVGNIIMTESERGLLAWHLEIHQAQEYRSSPQPAYSAPGRLSAHTSTSTMKELHPTQQFSGTFQMTFFQKGASSSKPGVTPEMTAIVT